MVQAVETPFLKASTSVNLSPSPVHHAFSAAASYVARTNDNEDIDHSVIIATSGELLKRACWSFEEHLAIAQALLLLHIIQLFDGDIQMRSEAETQSVSIQARMMSLLERLEQELPDVVSDSAWPKWTFMESVRRTYLTYVFVEAIYANLKQGYCELVPLLSTLPLALDGALWNAKSETEWTRLTNTRSPAVITYVEAVPIWHEMKSEQNRDLETLQEMLWAAYKGEIPLTRRTGLEPHRATAPGIILS